MQTRARPAFFSDAQLPAGYISTKIGGAKVLAAGVALWSFGTLIAPPAAQTSLVALCATRVLVGLGEGFAPSAATAVLAKLVPSTERSRAVSTVWGGLDIGSAVGLLLCGPLIRMFGWPSVFYLFAVLGLVWAAMWPLVEPEKVDDDVSGVGTHAGCGRVHVWVGWHGTRGVGRVQWRSAGRDTTPRRIITSSSNHIIIKSPPQRPHAPRTAVLALRPDGPRR
jgi:MFS family permease